MTNSAALPLRRSVVDKEDGRVTFDSIITDLQDLMCNGASDDDVARAFREWADALVGEEVEVDEFDARAQLIRIAHELHLDEYVDSCDFSFIVVSRFQTMEQRLEHERDSHQMLLESTGGETVLRLVRMVHWLMTHGKGSSCWRWDGDSADATFEHILRGLHQTPDPGTKIPGERDECGEHGCTEEAAFSVSCEGGKTPVRRRLCGEHLSKFANEFASAQTLLDGYLKISRYVQPRDMS